MLHTAVAYPKEHATDHHYEKIEQHEEELRAWDIRDDDNIWPLSPVARQMYKAGETIAAHFQSSKPFPDKYAWALSVFTCCYRHGLVAIGRSHPLPPLGDED